jgi:hypothetical protein
MPIREGDSAGRLAFDSDGMESCVSGDGTGSWVNCRRGGGGVGVMVADAGSGNLRRLGGGGV